MAIMSDQQIQLSPVSENDYIDHEELVTVVVSKRIAGYYIVSPEELEDYAQFGWLSTIFLSLFALFAGFTLSCAILLVEGNLTISSQINLRWLSGLGCFVSVIFFVVSIALLIIQKNKKKRWVTHH